MKWQLSGNLHVVDVTGVRHLLHIDTSFLLHARQHPDDRLLHHVLQVGKAPPDVPHILKGVSPRTRVPVPKTEIQVNKYSLEPYIKKKPITHSPTMTEPLFSSYILISYFMVSGVHIFLFLLYFIF